MRRCAKLVSKRPDVIGGFDAGVSMGSQSLPPRAKGAKRIVFGELGLEREVMACKLSSAFPHSNRSSTYRVGQIKIIKKRNKSRIKKHVELNGLVSESAQRGPSWCRAPVRDGQGLWKAKRINLI
jgi:hypothetical protein